ncbi:hypothetical protein HMPREF0005_05833 [Achromobacter xylosoxidans C54]|uniref:PulJ/GspJ family protein n=1 Tax=Alcaligenes xylosoxydans xylosoxydans TaxID=85698 RepID=UPI0001F43106|nr:prepilin-type N-terminal cleavage/methylation domain-containing protein [Achromobacter xylosoxidans]EFV87063.1 hypothetical protein HMPREF0005_05833 [Achromobacter xylosoxidans C54]
MTGQRQAGFTLIEVVIAIMIMAVISLISWRAIDSVALTSRRLDQHTEEALALQRAFDQFERDIGARSPDLAEAAARPRPRRRRHRMRRRPSRSRCCRSCCPRRSA